MAGAAALGAGLAASAVAGSVLAADGRPVPDAVLAAARLLLDACGVAAVGLAVLGWLLRGGPRRDVDTTLAAARRAAVITGGSWAAVALLLLWLQTAEVAAQPPHRVGLRALVTYVGGFQSAAALLATAAFALAYTAVTVGVPVGVPAEVTALGRPGLRLVLAVGGLVPAPLTGHASTAPVHELAVVSVALHATAAAVWVGGLGALLTLAATRRALVTTALPRFSALATAAIATVAAGGVLTAAVRLGSLAALTGTGYGRVVLLKAAVLATIGVLGFLGRRRLLPAARDHRAGPRLAVLAGAELVLMATALGLAAALTRATP